MKVFLICLLIILICILLLLFVKIKLAVYLSTQEKSLYVKIGFIKIQLYPVDKKEKKKKESTDENIKSGIDISYKFLKQNAPHIKETLLRLKRRLCIEKFNFEYVCSFSDAALTAVMYGVVNGIWYNVFAFLDRNFKVKQMQGSIRSEFGTNKKHIALSAVFYLTVSDIIYIAVAMLPVIKNIKNK